MIHNQTVRLNLLRYKAFFLSVRELSESLKDVDTVHPQINSYTLPSALSSNIFRYKCQKLKPDTFFPAKGHKSRNVPLDRSGKVSVPYPTPYLIGSEG